MVCFSDISHINNIIFHVFTFLSDNEKQLFINQFQKPYEQHALNTISKYLIMSPILYNVIKSKQLTKWVLGDTDEQISSTIKGEKMNNIDFHNNLNLVYFENNVIVSEIEILINTYHLPKQYMVIRCGQKKNDKTNFCFVHYPLSFTHLNKVLYKFLKCGYVLPIGQSIYSLTDYYRNYPE
jgi:hypothetical protein